ncbi:PR domain zinc finger protein 12 [Geodia barretti]|nr:PR domain zinc finger protein 12 [Geodia barretti]
MEAGVGLEDGVLAQPNGCRSAANEVVSDDGPRAKGPGNAGSGISFSKELISFSLYGKIPRKSKRPWNESLSSKIAEVQESFKNIPSMLYFSPSSVTFDGIGVYVAETLPKGTMLGPYFGKTVHKEATEETHEWLWEVYQDSSLAYFIDASDPKYGNWMNFIQCARNQQEQNLKALQYSGCLYFESVRDVTVGEELLVWYDEMQYEIYMGIPVGYRGKPIATGGPSSRSSSTTESYPGSRPSSENSEDIFISSCPAIGTAVHGPASGSGHSDTSSASTDDSGISVSFEHAAHNPTSGTGTVVGAVGGNLGSGNTPMDTSYSSFSSTAADNGGVFHGLPGNHSESSVYIPAQSHLRSSESLTSLSQPTPIQLPVFVATDTIHQKVSDLKVAAAVGTTRPRFGLGPVSLLPSTAVAGGRVECGKESSGASWTQIPSGGGYSILSPGVSGKQLSTQLGSREGGGGGGLVLWSTGTNSPTTSTPLTVNNASGGGGGRGEKQTLLYGMFVRTDDGTRWQCVECKRLFSSQGSLRAHARIHTGERPYQCQYCFRTFCQASTLRSHERLHTGEKPYKCEHCGRAFTQSAGLRSHLKTHRYDS